MLLSGCVGILAVLLPSKFVRGQLQLIDSRDPYSSENEFDLHRGGAGRRLQDGFCVDAFSVKKGSVVQVSKSEKLGGHLVNQTSGLTGADCLKRCCMTDRCTVAAYEQQGRLNCYLFDCGSLDDFRCELVPYGDYEVGILTTTREELKKHLHVEEHPSASRNNFVDRPDGHGTTAGGCRSFEFKCLTSGECIAGYDRCNGAYECPDHSDEKDCDQFRQEQLLQAHQHIEKYQESQDSHTGPMLEDEMKMAHGDDSQKEPIWDRGRNRQPAHAAPGNDHRISQWDFRQSSASKLDDTTPKTWNMPTVQPVGTTSPPAPATGVPAEKISTTISIISPLNPSEIQALHIEKTENHPDLYPSWINFSDPTHFIISVVLIVTISFCAVTTIFVICRCICTRKPKVTKYRIVDPDAEDFLLGGSA